MEKLKVFDFDYGCGGFSKGLEETGLFEVTYNGSINDKNKFCYNNSHQNDFDSLDIIPNDVDLVVYTPHLGNKLYGIGRQNFQFSELNNFTALTTIKDFQNIIFITSREAIPLLQSSNEVLYTFDGTPTIDIISCRLLKLNYNVFNFVLDGAGFGLPQHRYYNIYWASKDIDKSIEINEGFGLYKRKYRTVGNVLKDITDESDINWHNPFYKKKDVCSKILPGQRASSVKEISQSSGYIRLDENNLAQPLLYDFYNFSSKGPSINPWYDRALTIREGARLFGLSDDFIWDNTLSKKEVALMIYESFPPVISKLMGKKIAKFIKKE